ncbi:protoporphyrinogen oxidase [Breoghania corrubedonensis]|uniref:Protoporphyrinogen oxidase n=1 Tax=Breoghania corrubedonensis TaxID=665038 RepID=A0A2T5V1R0_9HYPH|nr:flavodoxin domain-containing protein [Breoghania corrubedonensis]PTW57668.1 protoporphyrinogen oxidase [Breoghania corrubedonensis]
MGRIDIFFASRDGQTRKIATVLRDLLAESCSGDIALIDLEASGLSCDEIGQADFTIVAAPIRYGYPLAAADRFLRAHLRNIPPDRLAILLVCLLARKPDRTSAQTNGYLRRWLKKLAVKPALAAAIAGRLNYPAYRWYDLWMMRLILLISGGPTERTAQVEYTDWRQVADIAERIGHLCEGAVQEIGKLSLTPSR